MKIGIVGCKGRVGSLLVQELLSGKYDGLTLGGGTALPGDITGKEEFFVTDSAEELFKKVGGVIDFTTPDATRKHAWLAAKHKTAYVVGTTGLTSADEKELHDAAKETAILYTANMSVGVNILLALVEQAAARLKDNWDIEIFESHHKHKVDAPSGTALALGKAAAKGRNVQLDKVSDVARHGQTGARKPGQIGFSVARGGDVVGDHTVYFYSEGERIELTHRATNRILFVHGALRAMAWLKDQKPGLYSMKDALGL